ncbi:23S rRNA (guanosine(2251)-2'-O)-methyltransferase RlmB [Phycicoccus endophyticus]|uniref:23S rRNA (guanosine(2251)-2'-O)-methyltransferase RlmB n=1 Tax=Phycicoccus endophyticus TaxID=1690220 RepID=UPI00140DEB2E|nr:23S rRNA (guanosine(2251)-2'-O)-methyltransferase RlmB [Phycicoccus endophyticus]NHI18596.1 23S rRNA (guanosine(2251)-2'-O)-methyltransferase RlmB [Phycicoccus endophyticus]GGL33179.1 23S rRNA (guanosine(2251)-2'-O)-methyltransferase RlmB [Phycicoccus endophyticus]
MAGNSQRRGAVRKGGKKGPTAGSGGQRRKGLEGKGPTPKAEDRPHHKAHRGAKGAGTRPGGPAGTGRGRPTGARRKTPSSEVVAGRNAVIEALRAHVPVTTMYVAGRIDADDRVREAVKTAAERGIPVLETPRGELDRLTDGAVHQGLAVQVPPYEYAHPRDLLDPQAPGVPLLVALDGITDPRNLGAIVRSVAAFGGHGVVVPSRRSAGMTASAWKTSAGAAARIPVAQAANLTRALEDFRTAGFFVIGLDMDGEVELPDLELASEPLVVVVGSEGKGLSRLVRETCDQIVSVPMSSAVESLNAGIATGVTLYEVARRRRP